MIYSKAYEMPPINESEILRYAGAKKGSDEVVALMREAVCEAEGSLAYKVCWGYFPVTVGDGAVDFGFTQVSSSSLAKNLAGCEKTVLFAATVGLGIDRLIARYGIESPAKALMLQAIGAERIEALCDMFSAEISELAEDEGLKLAPRFSPGYGDLPIELQREIFSVLDCPKRIGLMLNESMLMSPTKSVTAIIGLKNTL